MAPEAFVRNQISSYGGKLSYLVTYSGYNMNEKGVNEAPDVLMIGNGEVFFFVSGKR